jgi:hypothetical protein
VVAVGDTIAIGRTSTTTETTRGNAEDLEAPKQSPVEDVMKIESLDREGPEIALRLCLLEVRRTRSLDLPGKALQHRWLEGVKGHFHHKLPRSS